MVIKNDDTKFKSTYEAERAFIAKPELFISKSITRLQEKLKAGDFKTVSERKDCQRLLAKYTERLNTLRGIPQND